MITCHLFQNNNHITLTPYDSDMFSEHTTTLELDEETVNEILDVQDKYRKLQKKLRNFLETHEK